MLVVSIAVAYGAEQHGSPAQRDAEVATASADGSTGGNLEGKEQRFGIANSAALGRDHDSRVERLGQLRPRRLHRHRRHRAAGEHDDRRGDLRRGGLGPLRDAPVRNPGGLHRRPDGRPNARVPGQEDRGARGQAHADRSALPGSRRARARPRWRSPPSGAAPSIYNSGPQGFSETLYAYTSQGNNNGSAFAGYTGYVQPNAPGNVGAFGITFADVMGGLAMLAGALRAAARRARASRGRWR